MGKLNFKVYRPEGKAIFGVTSTIVYGEKEAWLIDAQFQGKYAKELAEEVKKLGRKLSLIYISHFDPDYYFGLSILHKEFPEAQIVSTAETAWMIESSMDDKLAVWKEELGEDAPEGFVVPKAVKTLPLLEGNEVRIVKNAEDREHSYLYIPSEKTILGGVSVTYGSHLWTADSRNSRGIAHWISQLESMKALNPVRVIPGHGWQGEESEKPEILDFLISYLHSYKALLEEGKTAEEMVSTMKKQYPSLGGDYNLTFGAEVLTGKTPWKVLDLYPGVGRWVTADFSPTVFDLEFKDNKMLYFIQTAGEGTGYEDTMEYTAVETAPGVYMVHWQEANGIAVLHVQNWNTMDVWTNIYIPGKRGIHMKGKLTIKK